MLVALLLATAQSLPFSAYLAEADAAFESSPVARGLRQVSESAQRGARERLAQSPVRLGASAAATAATLAGAGRSYPQPSLTFGPQATASYLPRSGFAATAQGSYSFSTRPGEYAGLEGSQPFSLSVDLSYDIVQGGARSTAWLRASSAHAQALAQGHSALQQLLDVRIEFGSLMSAVYASRCGVALLASVRDRIDQTVASAGLQLDTGIMGQRDYFNFAALDNGFASQQVQLEAALAEQRQRVRAFGPVASRLAEAGATDESCQVDIAATRALATDHVLSPAAVERMVASLPASQGAREAHEAATASLEALEQSLLPGVTPFVSAQASRVDFSTRTLAQVVLGVSVDFTIPGERGRRATEEAALGVGATKSLEQDARLRARASLQALNTQLRSQVGVLEVLEKALADSARLIAVLEAQQLIGGVDSLNFTTAYLNDVSLRQALLTASAALHQSIFALQAYERAVWPARGRRGPPNGRVTAPR